VQPPRAVFIHCEWLLTTGKLWATTSNIRHVISSFQRSIHLRFHFFLYRGIQASAKGDLIVLTDLISRQIDARATRSAPTETACGWQFLHVRAEFANVPAANAPPRSLAPKARPSTYRAFMKIKISAKPAQVPHALRRGAKLFFFPADGADSSTGKLVPVGTVAFSIRQR